MRVRSCVNMLAFNEAINNVASKGYEADTGGYHMDYGNLLAFCAEYERLKCEKIKKDDATWDGYRSVIYNKWRKDNK